MKLALEREFPNGAMPLQAIIFEATKRRRALRDVRLKSGATRWRGGCRARPPRCEKVRLYRMLEIERSRQQGSERFW